MSKTKISIKLPDEDILFIQSEITRMGGPRKSNVTEQVHIAITQRRLSMMSDEEREKVISAATIAEPVDTGEGVQEEFFDEE